MLWGKFGLNRLASWFPLTAATEETSQCGIHQCRRRLLSRTRVRRGRPGFSTCHFGRRNSTDLTVMRCDTLYSLAFVDDTGRFFSGVYVSERSQMDATQQAAVQPSKFLVSVTQGGLQDGPFGPFLPSFAAPLAKTLLCR